LDVVGVGEAMVELWSEAPLGKASILHRGYGGDVLNTLVMCSRLGLRTGFVSRVGNDPFGSSLIESWQAESVDTQCCPLVDGKNGVYFISRLPGGQREFSYRRSRSAASEIKPENIHPAYLAESRVLLVSGITQAISSSAEAATLHAVETARKFGTVVAYDPNYRPQLWRDRSVETGVEGLELAKSAFQTLLPLVDILLISHPDDVELLENQTSDALEVVDSLRRNDLTIAIKRGAEGGTLSIDGHTHSALPTAIDRVADTTGAGDAWNAGLLYGLLRQLPPDLALQFANAVAAWKIGRFGAIPLADSELTSLKVLVTIERN
jgi:2-dehydro-3-deoxygluconokinase